MNPFDKDIDYISALGDRPNSDDGLSAAELKARFDAAANDLKDYLNTVVVPFVDDLQRQVQEMVSFVVPDGSITTEKFAKGDDPEVSDEPACAPLAENLLNTLGANKGGTGRASLTAGRVLMGNGTDPVEQRAVTDNSTATAPNQNSTNLITERTLKNAIGVSGGAAAYDSVYAKSQTYSKTEADGKYFTQTSAESKADTVGGKVKPEQASAAMDSYSASGTLELSDAGKLIVINAAATITIPKDIFPVGAEIEVLRDTDDEVLIIGAEDVTIIAPDITTNRAAISVKYGTAVIKQISANRWLIGGMVEESPEPEASE